MLARTRSFREMIPRGPLVVWVPGSIRPPRWAMRTASAAWPKTILTYGSSTEQGGYVLRVR